MTDYDKLAQRAVAQGLGSQWPQKTKAKTIWYSPQGNNSVSKDADTPPIWFQRSSMLAYEFCKDGRVVLAAMDACLDKGLSVDVTANCVYVCSNGTAAAEHVAKVEDYIDRHSAILNACLTALEQ